MGLHPRQANQPALFTIVDSYGHFRKQSSLVTWGHDIVHNNTRYVRMLECDCYVCWNLVSLRLFSHGLLIIVSPSSNDLWHRKMGK